MKHYFPRYQCIILQTVHGERSLQVHKRSLDFSVTEYETFIDRVSDSTLQLTSKSTTLTKIWCSIKEKYLQLSGKAIKILFPSQLHLRFYVRGWIFLTYFPRTKNNILKVECRSRI